MDVSGGSSRIFRNTSASFQRMVSAPSRMKTRRRPCGRNDRGPLDGAQLADADHRTSDRRSQANGIRDDGPDVGIRLQNQRLAFDGGGVGAFAALGEALLDQRVRVGEAGDFPAGITFAAEIVFQAFAIRGLREHSREREFADAARAGEKQSAGHSLACEHAFECGDDAFVAEKLIEAHDGLACRP